MTLRPFYAYEHDAPAEPEEIEPVNDAHTVAHGYNLADIDRLARFAVARCRWRGGSYDEKWQEAWSAIAEQVCTSLQRPGPDDLIHTGMVALSYLRATWNQTWGIESGKGLGERANFVKYWHLRGHHVPFEERYAEHDAFWQIWEVLPERHRRVLKLTAALECDVALIAEALGLSIASAYTPLSEARRAFKAYWYDGDTPPKARRASEAKRSRFTADQVEQMRDLYDDGHPQTDIARRFGISRAQVSRLINGKQRPAKDSS